LALRRGRVFIRGAKPPLKLLYLNLAEFTLHGAFSFLFSWWFTLRWWFLAWRGWWLLLIDSCPYLLQRLIQFLSCSTDGVNIGALQG
jgi:hypothetical protein